MKFFVPTHLSATSATYISYIFWLPISLWQYLTMIIEHWTQPNVCFENKEMVAFQIFLGQEPHWEWHSGNLALFDAKHFCLLKDKNWNWGPQLAYNISRYNTKYLILLHYQLLIFPWNSMKHRNFANTRDRTFISDPSLKNIRHRDLEKNKHVSPPCLYIEYIVPWWHLLLELRMTDVITNYIMRSGFQHCIHCIQSW